MKILYPRHLLIGLIMLAAAGLALALTPRLKVADQGLKINLEAMIPKQFGEWKLDETIAPIMFSPDVQAGLDKIYNQMLNRTYINSQGEQIMLSIAYGGEQSYSMQVHRPEMCYPAQGFQVGAMSKGVDRCRRGQIARDETGGHPRSENRTDNLLGHDGRFGRAGEYGAAFGAVEIWPDRENSLRDIDQGLDHFSERSAILSNRGTVCARHAGRDASETSRNSDGGPLMSPRTMPGRCLAVPARSSFS